VTDVENMDVAGSGVRRAEDSEDGGDEESAVSGSDLERLRGGGE
jgi:hypothetical protein